MDKQNYTLRDLKSQDVKQLFEDVKEKIVEKLKSKNVIKRKRKIQSYETLLQAMYLYIVDNLSYQRLADVMACKYNIAITDTAWKNRMKVAIPLFYEAVWEYNNEVLTQYQKKKSDSQKEKSDTSLNEILNNYNCYALDATNLPIEGEHSKVMRVHTQYSLNSDCIVHDLISDNHTAESTKNFPIEKNSLYLADRAYGKSQQLVFLLDKNADFIIRFSPSQIVFYEDSKCKIKINLQEKISNANSFSQKCYVKYQSKSFPVTIIGEKKPDEKHKESERKVKRKAQKNQQKLSQKTLDFSKWFFVVTTLDETLSNAVIEFYRFRWQIELFFKRSKSLLNFHKIRHSYSKNCDLVVTLWFAIAYLICCIKIQLINEFDLNISEYNLFSLIIYLFS